MPYQEYTIASFVESKIDLIDKIRAIDVIIERAELSLLDAAGNSGIGMYELDDGQVRIKTQYTSLSAVVAGLDALQKLRSRYVNRLNGRTTVLVDKRALGGTGFGC